VLNNFKAKGMTGGRHREACAIAQNESLRRCTQIARRRGAELTDGAADPDRVAAQGLMGERPIMASDEAVLNRATCRRRAG